MLQYDYIVLKEMKLINFQGIIIGKTNEYINKPIDNFNHGIDALRYGLEDIMQNKTARIVDGSKWGGIF